MLSLLSKTFKFLQKNMMSDFPQKYLNPKLERSTSISNMKEALKLELTKINITQ